MTRPPDPDAAAERELIHRALWQGEFAVLVRRFQRLAAVIAQRLGVPEQELEEVCQEIFLRVYRFLPNYRGEAPLRAWVGRIAHNTAQTWLSQRRRLDRNEAPAETRPAESAHEPSQPAPEKRLLRRQAHKLLHEQIERLPPHYRTALALYHLEEMSVREAALVMAVPENTFKSYLLRARQRLKTALLAHCRIEELLP